MWGFPGGRIGGRVQLPGHQLERGPAPVVGAARDLAGWPRRLGRHRRRDARRSLGAAPPPRGRPCLPGCATLGLLVAQAIGRVGNYFNQELFGGPTSLPWGLEMV